MKHTFGLLAGDQNVMPNDIESSISGLNVWDDRKCHDDSLLMRGFEHCEHCYPIDRSHGRLLV